MHPALAEQLEPLGGVTIDFVDEGEARRGFMVSTNKKPEGFSCSSGECGSGACGDTEDGHAH